MLNKSGITKTKGASPIELFSIVFNLAFIGKNFFEGVVWNKKIAVGKDAVYNFLNSSTYNWRRFTFLFSSRIYFLIKNLLDNSSEEVLIFDDSPYDRSRSKKVELLSRVFDHTTKILIWSSKNGHPVKRLLPKKNYSQKHLGFYIPKTNGDDGYYKTFRYT